jgi:hypothetical protein
MDIIMRNLSIGLALLIIFAPLGLLAAGTAYGEWGPNELKDRIGFVPHGLKELYGLWNAPMQDYSVSGDGDSRIVSSAGYILSALVGVIVGGSLLYFIGKKVVKN